MKGRTNLLSECPVVSKEVPCHGQRGSGNDCSRGSTSMFAAAWCAVPARFC
jgi:hypothetical protein